MKIVKIIVAVLFLCVSFNKVFTLNILAVLPYQGKSHFFVFEPYLHELAKRGHNLTVISHFPQRQQLKNYQDISLAGKVNIIENIVPLELSISDFLRIGYYITTSGIENCKLLLENENVQKLWKDQVKFDLIVVEQFNSDCALGLAYKLEAPVVGLTSHVLMPWHHDRLGIPYNPSYVPSMFSGGGFHPNLYQRVEKTIYHFLSNLMHRYILQRCDQNTLAEYFNDIPPLEELTRNIKFMLIYQNFVLTGSRLLPANVKEVGGYHVAKPKTLPDDLNRFIEESINGVIYISFGSMVKASSVPKEKLEAIIGAISELPQRIIWKWDQTSLPGNLKNIYLSKWLPQNDILAHPKVLVFYSHGGMLGTTEAIHHGVPLVAMPVFGDQISNAAAIEECGLGVQIQVNELTKENLLQKFRTVLEPRFHDNVKLLSKAWHDRPVSAMDSAIYWTEFAARHHNFTFRTASTDVPLYQYLCLDILLVLLIIPILIAFRLVF